MIGRIAARLGVDGDTRQFARGTSVSFLIQGAGAGLIFLSEIIMARILGTGGYGLFATVMAWSQVLVLVVLLGTNNLLLRFVPTYLATADWCSLRGLLRFSARISVLVGIGIVVAVVCGVVVVGERMPDDTRWALLAGFSVLHFSALSLQRQAVLRGLQRVATALIPEMIFRPVLLMTFAGGLAWGLGRTLSAPAGLAANSAAVILAFLLGWYWQRRTMPVEVGAASPVSDAFGWLKVSIPLFVVTCMQLLLVRMDIMILGLLSGRDHAGIYAAGSRVADLIVFALGTANIVAAPMIAALHARGDMRGIQRLLRLLSIGILSVALPVAVMIFIFGGDILAMFGTGYRNAYVPLQILVFAQLVNALCGPVSYLLAMTGHQRVLMIVLSVAAALNLVLNLLLIPAYGIVGAAIATAVTTVIWNTVLVYVIRRNLGVQSSVLALWRAGT